MTPPMSPSGAGERISDGFRAIDQELAVLRETRNRLAHQVAMGEWKAAKRRKEEAHARDVVMLCYAVEQRLKDERDRRMQAIEEMPADQRRRLCVEMARRIRRKAS